MHRPDPLILMLTIAAAPLFGCDICDDDSALETLPVVESTVEFTAAPLATEAAGFPAFTVHEMGERGNKQGQTSLVDVDHDGDLDFISGNRNNEVRWWEYRGADEWVPHRIGSAGTDVGGVALDIDGDGWVDQVSGNTWFRNPGPEGQTEEWPSGSYGGVGTHDQRAADIDRDGRQDVISLFNDDFHWFRMPGDPTNEDWPRTTVGAGVHSGLAIDDIDGDHDLDIVRGRQWHENTDGVGGSWTMHSIPTAIATSGKWLGSTAAGLADLDGDGDLDLAASHHDGSMVGWVENADGQGTSWNDHILYNGMDKCHSLQVADFDNDGDPDIYAGDTSGTANIWINDGSGGFSRQIIATEVPGHETRAADVDNDGDIDLCSKPWNGGRHVFLRNRLVEDGGAARRLLVFSKTEGFRHTSINAGRPALVELGLRHGYAVDTSEDGTVLNVSNLARYEVVIFLNTTGNFLTTEQEEAVESFIKDGGGWVGIHAAADAYGGRNHEATWPWYSGLLGNGAHFAGHPGGTRFETLEVLADHPSTHYLPRQFDYKDEYYTYVADPAEVATVLLRLESGTPVAWHHDYDGGRAFYTCLGHRSETFRDDRFIRHIWGGIQWAAGQGAAPPPVGDPPTITAGPTAIPDPVTGTTTTCSVTATDDGDDALLQYDWSANGPAAVAFDPDANTTAADTTATFQAAGSYTIQVQVRDEDGRTTTGETTVTVQQHATQLQMSP